MAGTVRSRPRRQVAAVLGVVLSLLVSAVALGYWTESGIGAGQGTASTALPLTLTAGTPSAQLRPGGQADVALTLTNPNPFAVRVGWLTLDTRSGTGGFAVDAAHATCGVFALSYTAQSNAGAGWTVPPKVGGVDGSLAVDLLNALSMSPDAASACQGASFKIYLAVVADYRGTVLDTADLAGYWRLGATPSVADSFTGTAGTAVPARSGEIRALWTQHSGTAPLVLTGAGRARKGGTGGGALSYATSGPSSADYSVEADLYAASDLAGDQVGVVGRFDPAAGTYYLAWYDRDAGGFHLLKMSPSGNTWLGCWCAGTLGVGQSHRLRLELTGSASTVLKLYVDGVLRHSATDSTAPHTAAGRGGIQDGDANSAVTKSDPTGVHADNFRIVPAAGTTVTDSKGANNGTFVGPALLNEPGALAGDANRAVRWDGSTAYATIPDAAALDVGDGPFTLETWVRRLDAGTGRQTLMHKGAGSFQWAFDGNRIGLYKDGGTLVAQATTTQTDTSGFHHYAVVKNGPTVRLYVDGVDVTGAVTDQTLTDTASPLTLGSRGGSADFLNGVQDDTAVYKAALSAATVQAHHRVGCGC